VQSTGSNWHEDAFKIDAHDTETVTFTLTQLFGDSMPKMSVQYDDAVGSSVCAMSDNVSNGAELSYTAVCFHGYASVNVYVYSGPDSLEECDACQAGDASTDMDVYYLEVPCDSPCAPEDETPGTPADLPDCYTGAHFSSVDGECPSYSDMPIVVDTMDGASVTFNLKQTWIDSMDSLTLLMPVSDAESLCYTKTDVGSGLIAGSYEASCNADGYAEVTLYASDADFTTGNSDVSASCSMASPPTAESTCAYHFILPCKAESMCPTTPATSPTEPVASPTEPVASPTASTPESCDDAVKLAIDDEALPLTDSTSPLTLDGQGDGTADVTVTQIFKDGQISWISLVYKNPEDGSIVCEKQDEVDAGVARSVTAECVDGIAQVDVYVHDGSFHTQLGADHPNPGYCDGWLNNDSGIVAYTFLVPCTCSGVTEDDINSATMRTTDTARHLDEEAFIAGAKPEADATDEDVPYCVSADFPCEGEGDDMVFVCHYSARKGYQTFCIPESDSDILRFYPNDYCGPCEGGYGGLF
jgi:hypothetical protein